MKRLFFKSRISLFDLICAIIVASLNNIFKTAWFLLLLAVLMILSIKFENQLKERS